MIISASRRTDIPAFYSDWFFGRIKAGYAEVKNPFNPSAVRRVSLRPEDVDCFVFWTKNPLPMLDRLESLKDFDYCFQFTLTAYGADIEPHVPSKNGSVINTFKELSEKIGCERITWRYDPILVTTKYSVEYHINRFAELAEKLNGFFGNCVISFADCYKKTEKRFMQNGIRELTEDEIHETAKGFSEISARNGFKINTCAEKTDLSRYGIGHSRCIDKNKIEELIGRTLDAKKDKNQRKECGCCESVDIGAYNTCTHGCLYCYATASVQTAEKNSLKHSADSPFLL